MCDQGRRMETHPLCFFFSYWILNDSSNCTEGLLLSWQIKLLVSRIGWICIVSLIQ